MKKFRCTQTKIEGNLVAYTRGAYYYEPDPHLMDWQEFSKDLICIINNHGEQRYMPASVVEAYFVEVTESRFEAEPMFTRGFLWALGIIVTTALIIATAIIWRA